MKKKRVLVKRTRGAGTLTESAFWSLIRSTLREKSRYWKPVSVCRNNARRKYEGTNRKQKYEYQCNYCKKWYPATQINVDHIIPVGNLTCSEDLSGFVNRLFVEVDSLQILCKDCHDVKTKEENDGREKKRKIDDQRNKRQYSKSKGKDI